MIYRNLLKGFLSAVLLLVTFNLSAQKWDAKADMPDAREGAICFSLNGKIYWGGGTATGQSQISKDFYEYDPTADTWTPKSDLPEERGYCASFSINGKGYIAMGRKSGSSNFVHNSTYEYDPTADTWTKKADFTLNNGTALYRVNSFVINGKAYITGGYTQSFSGNNGKLFEYDPAADTWTEKAGYPYSAQGSSFVGEPMMFSINQKGYIAGGEVRKQSGPGSDFSKKVYEYDPANDTWTPKADYPGDGRSNGAAFVKDGKGYCGLGFYRDPNFQSVFLKDMYMYDPANDTWTKTTEYPGAARVYPQSAVVNGVAYVGGGSEWQSGYKKDFYSIGTPNSVQTVYGSNNKLVKLYPIPATTIVNITSDTKFKRYWLFDIKGVVVKQGILSNNKIDINQIAPGTYFLRLLSGETKAQNILIIQ